MSPNEYDPEDSERAGHAGGPETGLAPVGMDIGDFAGSMAAVLTRAAAHPAEVAAASLRFGASLAQVGQVAFSRWLGVQAEPPLAADPKDRRFADPAWEKNPAFFALRQSYLAARQYGDDLLAAGASEPVADGKAQLVGSLLGDALAPTTWPATAAGRSRSTGGRSGSARTWPRPRARSSSATSSWS